MTAPFVTAPRKKVLMLIGGWEGHQPNKVAEFAEHFLLQDFDITKSTELSLLNAKDLAHFDLILPIWTFGKISEEQETALINAVQNGLGYVGWHGNTSAFLESRLHKLLLGGQFVAHPGGESVEYSVNFCDNDSLVHQLKDFSVVSEQYYLLVDPAVKVLATTTIHGGDMPWLKGTIMPVVWKRAWGDGRVFYCALGHTVDTLQNPNTTELLKRALNWACRNSSANFS